MRLQPSSTEDLKTPHLTPLITKVHVTFVPEGNVPESAPEISC